MPVEIDGEVYPDLPTVEECREFLRLVNVGREACGLDALEVLDFDDATPSKPTNCLSARNLFVVPHGNRGFHVFDRFVRTRREIVEALSMPRAGNGQHELPAAIYKVTDPFDAKTPCLRERMVEAGVVAP